MTPNQPQEKDQRTVIADFIATKCWKLACGICDKPDWQPGGLVILQSVNLTKGFTQPDPYIRTPKPITAADVAAVVCCQTCGRKFLFSAAAVGVDAGK